MTSPGEIIKLKYFEPSGMSMLAFARETGLPYDTLRLLMRNEQLQMSPKFIVKLSKATGTDPTYWYRVEFEYLFETYFKASRLFIKPIERKEISTLKLPETPGRVLYDNFIGPSETIPSRKAFHRIVHKTKIDESTLKNIFQGKRRINFIIAKRLSKGVGTTMWYWLDLQNKYEIQGLLKSGRKLNACVRSELEAYCDHGPDKMSSLTNDGEIKELSCAGAVLLHKFIIPSKVSISQWAVLFLIQKAWMNVLLKGKEEFSIELIIKLSTVFKTTINYWLSLQAEFYKKTDLKLRLPNTKTRKSNVPESVITPLVILKRRVGEFNWTLREFADHIGVTAHRLYTIDSHGIDFDLAIRIGQGLNMDPKFWLQVWLGDRRQERNKIKILTYGLGLLPERMRSNGIRSRLDRTA